MEVNGVLLFLQGIEFPLLSFSKTDVQISEDLERDHCLLHPEIANDLLLQQEAFNQPRWHQQRCDWRDSVKAGLRDRHEGKEGNRQYSTQHEIKKQQQTPLGTFDCLFLWTGSRNQSCYWILYKGQAGNVTNWRWYLLLSPRQLWPHIMLTQPGQGFILFCGQVEQWNFCARSHYLKF